MKEISINGALLKDMFLTGAALLEKNKAHIDSLNVFPVPDGDTGTNMSMTMQSAVREIKGCACATVSEVAAAASLGSLKGARGNSGVILSQIFRGFVRALDGATEMDGALLALALKSGTEAAYKAVMKPKEGTMLTVSRMIGEAVGVKSAEGANVYKLVDVMIERGESALRQTPELLPVLKEAGVVDSGGKGLLTIFRGFKMALDGEEVDDLPEEVAEAPNEDVLTLDDVNDITYGYCTEFFIIHLDDAITEEDLDKFRDKLIKIGDSVVVAHDTGVVKVHVHSNAPGKILQLALRLGELNNLKIENMREQNREIQAKLKATEKECAMVAVSTGEGIDAVFGELGVEGLIQGGQTMNPSIDTIAKAIRRVNARNVFVLPNNPNIILAAQQAAELAERNVIVLPTKTVMQGISAATAYLDDAGVADNEKNMRAAAEKVISGSVTFAVRDTSVNGTKIEKGNIIGLMDNAIVAVGNNVDEATLALLDKMMENAPEDSVVTLFYGEGVDADNAAALVESMEERHPGAEFLCQSGGQPLYYYYISVE
ncbi:MAG: DAK2 domain-containing protein [Candidatus Pelethousia sp.]|nr:DAK2 domain-containing protein [Candidatus Pelethousia sp.]